MVSGAPSPASAAVRKVNVGCGPHHQLSGWWNVDLREFPGVDQAMDATQPWPFENLEYVYGEHFLEHLEADMAIAFLLHAGDALRPGGKIRLSTPSLEWVVHTHFSSGPTPPETRLRETIQMNRAFYGWGHRFLWTSEMLDHVLRALGFVDVQFVAYGESRDPALRGVERHGKYSVADGRPSVIIVEATRAATPPAPDSELLAWLEQDFLRHVRAGH